MWNNLFQKAEGGFFSEVCSLYYPDIKQWLLSQSRVWYQTAHTEGLGAQIMLEVSPYSLQTSLLTNIPFTGF
jgi:hypothetical protein